MEMRSETVAKNSFRSTSDRFSYSHFWKVEISKMLKGGVDKEKNALKRGVCLENYLIMR